MGILETKDVTYSYSSENSISPALSGITMTVEKGEYIAVIGHNGSGKSTYAKLLNALFLPESGSVTVNGMDTKDEAKTWEIRKCAGMVFQNPDNQIIATIVEEDVAFGPENMGVAPGEIRERVDAALSEVGMSEYKQHAPHMLSGGQKQRVAIAGVLAMQPEILIFDEPTAMLDPEGREEVLSTIKRLNGEGKTIIYITHYMEEALLADKVYVMAGGKIVFYGSPRDIFWDREKIHKAGLSFPVHIELYHRLRERGFDLGDCPLTPEELVEKICRLS